MAEEVSQVVEGDGYAVGHIDTMGDRYGFRKIRRALGVSAFGINAVCMPPGYGGPRHYHAEQEETYFVHQGTIEMEFGDGTVHRLGPGGVARVDARTVRAVRSAGDDDAVYVCAGGKGGYVGRDGRVPEGEERAGRQAPPGSA